MSGLRMSGTIGVGSGLGVLSRRLPALVVALAFLAVSAAPSMAAPGDISTVAGNGTFGYLGDGGPARAAEFSYPVGVTLLPNGGYLIPDIENNVIRKVSATGIITTVAGTGTAGDTGNGGPATKAELNEPDWVALIPGGGYLISEYAGMVIRKVSAKGIISTVAGDGTAGYTGNGGPATKAELDYPYSVAPTTDGGFLIADEGNQVIRKVSAKGVISTVAGNGTHGYMGDGHAATAAELSDPSEVAPTPDGGYLIADAGNSVIRKVSAKGIITTVAGDGTAGYNGDHIPATAAELYEPDGVATIPGGGFLIADADNGRIRKVSAAGAITTVAGDGTNGYKGDGGPATAAELSYPASAVPTCDGGMLIADGNNVIRRVSGSGRCTVSVSLSGSGAGQVSSKPAGVSCPGACRHGYPYQTVVVLKATPAGGSRFAGWSGGCSGTGKCTVVLAANQTVKATFKLLPRVKITEAKVQAKQPNAKFGFKAIGPNTGFQCALVKLKKGKPAPKPNFAKCTSPKTYAQLKPGKYIFEVRALSRAGPGPVDKRSLSI